ncbi:XRE family transcriptional regulator [Flavobacterium davisii]|uniref:XRE family transcriptional regulator n=1 Tax=Flavobacterium davisii TaxID=2906077 RepID=A0A246GI10_9FLAO|nr:mobile mystery protein A [Flavobacterium davisii]OWP83897.1 XRE family transcriptional regulator [Flavobacterium davisii]
MKEKKRLLLIEQLDTKIQCFNTIDSTISPSTGWIKSIRTALKMSLRQLGNRMKISPQSISEMEKREASGTITLNTLKELAYALDMRLVYGFVPNSGSIEQMIEKRALEIAKEIVGRTHITMTLEDQQNSDERIQKAIKQEADEIKYEMPKYLWG